MDRGRPDEGPEADEDVAVGEAGAYDPDEDPDTDPDMIDPEHAHRPDDEGDPS